MGAVGVVRDLGPSSKVGDSTERGASPPGVGWYLYGFLSDGDAPSMAGIDGRSDLTLLAEAGICALASPVPLAEFGEEALRHHLNDLRWVEEKVRLHEAIVEAAMARGTILPARFCTLFADPQRILAAMRRNAPLLQEGFERVRGQEEWGVKGFCNREALQDSLLHADSTLLNSLEAGSGGAPGHAYLFTKSLDAKLAARAREREEETVRAAVAAIREKVTDLLEKPCRVPEGTGKVAIVLHLACLVRKCKVQEFLVEVDRWNRVTGPEGLRLLTSGPWPPYHFSPLLEYDE